MTMKPEEALSEQANIEHVAEWAIKRGEMLAKGDPIEVGGKFGDQDWVRAYVLARQLTEAERENGLLRNEVQYVERLEAAEAKLKNAAMRGELAANSMREERDEAEQLAERYREALERIEPLIDAQFVGHASNAEYMLKVRALNDAVDIVRGALNLDSPPKDSAGPSTTGSEGEEESK